MLTTEYIPLSRLLVQLRAAFPRARMMRIRYRGGFLTEVSISSRYLETASSEVCLVLQQAQYLSNVTTRKSSSGSLHFLHESAP